MMTTHAWAVQEVIDTLVRRTVDAVGPRRIVLFGSSARGAARPDSDVDFLVVMPDEVHRRRTAQAIHRCLAGLGVAKDTVVVTEGDVRDYGERQAPQPVGGAMS